MRSKKFIAANWKMHKTASQSSDFISDFTSKKQDFKCDVLICPPFLSVSAITKKCHDTGIYIGAQNCHFESSGAFTGEVSAAMLSDAQIDYVILGHSERRTYFCETDEIVGQKINSALKNNIKVLLCVGETQDQRNRGGAHQTVLNQIKTALTGVQADEFKDIIIAYEPVWAIGTGKVITPSGAGEMCEKIRDFAALKYGSEVAQNLRILYGGSINSENAGDFLNIPEINGALVGGASLEVKEFLKIVNVAENYQV